MKCSRSGFVKLAAALAGVAVIDAASQQSLAATFLPGDLAVLQVGATGSSTALTNVGTAAFVREFSISGTSVQTLAIPTVASGANQPLTISGTAGSEGELSLSGNGQYLVVGGYNVGLGAVTQTTSTVGLINTSGTIDTSTATSLLTGNNTRGAASSDGTQVWVTGPKGLISIPTDTTGGTNVASGVNLDGLVVVPASASPSGSNMLFGSSGKSPHGIVQFSSPLPTSTTTGTNLNGMSSTLNPAPFAFFFANPTTLFVADGSLGIQEWVSGGTTTWSEVATFNGAGGSFAGLTGVETGNTVELYATTGSSSGWTPDNSLVSIPFSFSVGSSGVGTFGASTVLATATGDSGFSGVAFTPIAAVPEPMSIGMMVFAAAGMLSRRRKTIAKE